MEPAILGKYELLKRIAAGGMAEIFVARVRAIPGFEKIVCIKRILPQLAGNREFVDMFLDEARIAATLHHPNVVQMYDVGEAEGSYFISMEYLHGVDVRTLIKGMRDKQVWIPIEHALHIVIGMCAGLHYAHEKAGFDGRPLGIVHRDINPQNVFVTYDGAVKIVDFGIAKATNRFNETRAGTLKGKIPYMSPEQCQSESLDRRSDVYAIGIMLYELTTAYRLYKGQSEFEVLKKIVEGTITPPTKLRPNFPPSLEAIVLRSLAKRREDRYQTARELQIDLETFAREHKLAISTIALSSYVHDLWPDKADAFQEARTRGKDLATLVLQNAPKSDPGASRAEQDELAELAGDDDSPLDTVTVAGTPRPSKRFEPGSGSGSGVEGSASARGQLMDDDDGPAVPDSSTAVLGASRRNKKTLVVVGLVAAAGVAALLALGGGGGGKKGTPVAAGGGELGGLSAVDAGAGGAGPAPAAPPDAAPLVVADPVDAGAATMAPARPDAGHKAHTVHKVEAGPPGELRVASSPSCEVLVDGKARGATPLGGLMLSPGKHKVQLVNSRFKIDQSYTVVVVSGEVTKKKWEFPTSP